MLGHQYSAVRPLVYEDGLTIVRQLEHLSRWLNVNVVDHINDEIPALIKAVDDAVVAASVALENVADELRGDVSASVDGVNQTATDLRAELAAAIQSVVNSSVELQDDVLAAIIRDKASESVSVLNGAYPVYRVWVAGVGYPDRQAGAVNIFFGPNDPGLKMGPNDYWANANMTTLGEVITQTGTVGSALNVAVRNATKARDVITVGAGAMRQNPADAAAFSLVGKGAGGTQYLAWVLNGTGVGRLYSTFTVPDGWERVRIEPAFLHNGTAEAEGANVYFAVSLTPLVDGPAIPAAVSVNTSVSARAAGQLKIGSLGPWLVTAGQTYNVVVTRNANASQDTVEHPIEFLFFNMRRSA